MNCSVCKSNLGSLLELGPGWCINSLGALLETKGCVYSCENCSHCETRVELDLSQYYRSSYRTLAHSAEEDDLYCTTDGAPVYRSDHMTRVFLEKMSGREFGDKEVSLLDYGCGKSLFGKRVSATNSGFKLHLYDVSDDYRDFWGDFCTTDVITTFSTSDDWRTKFDVVTSLFSLEHVPDPLAILRHVSSLLKEGGIFYIVVPNMYSENESDVLVVDHLHHYSPVSMRKMLEFCGFALQDEDATSHRQASIFIAVKVADEGVCGLDIAPFPMAVDYINRQREIAGNWDLYMRSLREFIDSSDPRRPVIVVGAGVLGSLAVAILDRSPRIAGFIDSNIFKQRKGWLDKPVYAPGCMPNSLIEQSPLFVMALNRFLIEGVGWSLVPDKVQKQSVWLPPAFQSGTL